MADRPIIFSAPMVRALLAGRKTQTRRVLKPQPTPRGPHGIAYDPGMLAWPIGAGSYRVRHESLGAPEGIAPYAADDRLWVREAWQTGLSDNGPQIAYRATPDYCEIDAWDGPDEGSGPSFNYDRCPGARWHDWLGDVLDNDGPWRSPIHMPRWASRLTLVVEEARVQRLQDISEDDAEAEGIFQRFAIGDDPMSDQWSWQKSGWRYPTPRAAYHALWEELHGPAAWSANPWVAAISFRVVKANIDAFEKEVAHAHD